MTACIDCGEPIKRNGKTKEGKQRWRCLSCGFNFTDNGKTANRFTHRQNRIFVDCEIPKCFDCQKLMAKNGKSRQKKQRWRCLVCGISFVENSDDYLKAVGRPRIHKTNAEKQRAYRQRKIMDSMTNEEFLAQLKKGDQVAVLTGTYGVAIATVERTTQNFIFVENRKYKRSDGLLINLNRGDLPIRLSKITETIAAVVARRSNYSVLEVAIKKNFLTDNELAKIAEIIKNSENYGKLLV